MKKYLLLFGLYFNFLSVSSQIILPTMRVMTNPTLFFTERNVYLGGLGYGDNLKTSTNNSAYALTEQSVYFGGLGYGDNIKTSTNNSAYPLTEQSVYFGGLGYGDNLKTITNNSAYPLTEQSAYFGGLGYGDNLKTASGTVSYAIGDAALGGKIAYLLVSGDSGYNATVQHGLVAASEDQGTASTGYRNPGDHGLALAMNYNGGGFTDWYLPSKEELNKLYLNRTAIGGFSPAYYWSSTSTDGASFRIWLQAFTNGYQTYTNNIYSDASVRAIRTF